MEYPRWADRVKQWCLLVGTLLVVTKVRRCFLMGCITNTYLIQFAVPAEESGFKSKFYYSFDAGGIHFIMLGAYVDYNSTGK